MQTLDVDGDGDDDAEESSTSNGSCEQRARNVIQEIQGVSDHSAEESHDDVLMMEQQEGNTFNVGDASPIYDELQRIFERISRSNLLTPEISEAILTEMNSGMSHLCMKERERGSITTTLKYNSLRGRWFSLDKAVNAEIIPIGTTPSDPMRKYGLGFEVATKKQINSHAKVSL